MILIIGGAGYIGSHTNKLLHHLGYETVVFDNLVHGHREFVKWGSFFLGDMVSKEQLRTCFAKYPIHAVVHFGAYAYVGESVSDPSKYYHNNVACVLNLLDVMREYDVKKIIFSSTCATYGMPQKLPIVETEEQKPINPYGRTKLMVETILKDYEHAYGIRHVNLRYFNAAGADLDGDVGERHDPETHLIPLVCEAALGKRDKIAVFGTDYPTRDGTCIRDYIHVTDLADAHHKALQYLETGHQSDSFNLGNGSGYSVNEVIESVKKVSGRDFPVVYQERRPGDPPILVGSNEKAQRILGWTPRYGALDTVVETAWQWHIKEHQKTRGLKPEHMQKI
ncbi:UDP-glucose 4-epimerase GalE [Candidatus Babeliales bacterium]|nr:UDP-glucose 4-epimerase GalE [Candidatus Babeliales bacterium]